MGIHNSGNTQVSLLMLVLVEHLIILLIMTQVYFFLVTIIELVLFKKNFLMEMLKHLEQILELLVP